MLKDQIFNIKYLEKKVYFGEKKYTRKLPQINVFIIIIIIIAYIIIINFKTPKSRKCKCIVFFQGAEKESDYKDRRQHLWVATTPENIVSSASFLCCLIIHI